MRSDALNVVLQAERVFVDLGCQYVVECSACEAEAILTRRRHSLGFPLCHGLDGNDLIVAEPSKITCISAEADACQERGAAVQATSTERGYRLQTEISAVGSSSIVRDEEWHDR